MSKLDDILIDHAADVAIAQPERTTADFAGVVENPIPQEDELEVQPPSSPHPSPSKGLVEATRGSTPLDSGGLRKLVTRYAGAHGIAFNEIDPHNEKHPPGEGMRKVSQRAREIEAEAMAAIEGYTQAKVEEVLAQHPLVVAAAANIQELESMYRGRGIPVDHEYVKHATDIIKRNLADELLAQLKASNKQENQ